MTETLTASTDTIQIPVSDTTLSNGLRVVAIPRYTSSVVSIAVLYRVGSKDESPKNTGFAHLFEHLMFEGSENVAHGEFDRYCSEAGGQNNAYTNTDKTNYHMTLPANQLELGLWLEAERMGRFRLSKQALETQQSVVSEEINQNVENQPYGRFSETLNRLAFAPQCSYSWDTYGDKAHVQHSTLDNVQNFHDIFYRPDNACLVICGAVSPERAFALAEKHFGSIPKPENPITRTKFSPEYRRGNQYAKVEDNIPFESVFLSFHFDGFLSDEYFTAEILTSILSDGMSSRFQRKLVYEDQIASETNAYVDDREWSSVLTMFAIAGNEKITAKKLSDAMWEILDDVAKNGVSENELMKAQNRLETRLARQLQTTAGIADEASHQTLFFGNPRRTFSLMDKVTSIKKEDIQRLAVKIFTPANHIRVDFVPAKQ